MLSKKFKYGLCIVILLSISFLSFSQTKVDSNQVSKARIKALFLIGFTKYVEWPGQGLFKNFTVAVAGKDSALIKELNSLADSRTFFGKKYDILQVEDSSNIPKCNILFVNKKSGFPIDRINKEIEGRPTLLVGEDYPFNTCMINFVTIDGTQKFQVNQEKMKEAELKYSDELIRLSTTIQEWQRHYTELLEKLIKEKEHTELQKAEIQKLQVLQEQQRKEIEKTQQELQEQEMYVFNQKLQLETLIKENAEQQKNLAEKIETLEKKDVEIKEKEKQILEQELNVMYQNDILTRQMKQIELQQEKINKQKDLMAENEERLKNQQMKLNFSLIFLTVIILVGVFIFRSYRVKEKANKILEEKNKAIEMQKKQIEEKNVAITSSINYAKKIQEAILPSEEMLDNLLPEYFVFNQPKDIVSGDFYWAYQSSMTDNIIFAVADCTGHGVPGAFMSLIGVSLLNEIVIENKIEDSAEILNLLREGIMHALRQKGAAQEAKDGMDIALCVWNKKKGKIEFSGAHNSLYLVRKNELHELKGDMQGIGFYNGMVRPFEKKKIDVKPNDLVYLFSDGFVDQKGGPKNKKFYYKPFRELITSISDLPLREQGTMLRNEFNRWKSNQQQIDDVCILGAKLA